MYLLNDGTETSRAEIAAAYRDGRAVLIHSHGDGRTMTGLMLHGVMRDTRGECWSVWDEVWTTAPADLDEALDAARVETDP